MSKLYDLIVVGAGPAGLTAAIKASSIGKSVLILEKNESAGKKLLICGNGRCNITNAEKEPHIFIQNYMKNPKFMLSMLHNYSNQDVCDFFEKNGVALKTEPEGRIFPRSNKAVDVLNVLLNNAAKNCVEIKYETPVLDIEKTNDNWRVSTQKGEFLSRNLLIATGGKTKQRTGSSGDGYAWAEKFGHKIIEPKKALYPFEVDERNICSRLSGLSVDNAAVTFKNNSGVLFTAKGGILFADFGLTGPTMINASLQISNAQMSGLKILIDLLPEYPQEIFAENMLKLLGENPNKTIAATLLSILPSSMPAIICEKATVPADKRCNQITREERISIERHIKSLEFTVSKYVIVNKSIVTDGGIDLKEIDNKTLESKFAAGLYFAGEIIDVVGKTGGFNLQVAWSTGWTAGSMIK